jgi:RimJ/RimL family protein N-acetyltransferase
VDTRGCPRRPSWHTAVVILEGRQVRLRGLEAADEPGLIAILSDPEVTQGLGLWALRPIGSPDVARLLAPSFPSAVRWAVDDRTDGALAGLVRLTAIDQRDQHADLDLVIGPAARWGRGLGTEAAAVATAFAFAHLNLRKVSAEIPVTLPAARAVAGRAGFALEGTLRRNRLWDGELVDVELWAAFADEPRWREAARWT